MGLVLAAALADLCGPVAPDGAPSPTASADSTAYVKVGDAARATGDVRVAATAYRMALAVDADNRAARAALAAMCATPAERDDSLIAALAMWSLARRFSPHPLWASLL